MRQAPSCGASWDKNHAICVSSDTPRTAAGADKMSRRLREIERHREQLNSLFSSFYPGISLAFVQPGSLVMARKLPLLPVLLFLISGCALTTDRELQTALEQPASSAVAEKPTDLSENFPDEESGNELPRSKLRGIKKHDENLFQRRHPRMFLSGVQS